MKKTFLPGFLALMLFTHTAQAQTFEAWLQDFKGEARGRGISEALLNEALDGVTPNERVLELDTKQPESTKTFEEYLAGLVTQKRINAGREALAANSALLGKISSRYGVQPEVIVALWGVETNYGDNTGNFSTIEGLATLAYDGRRSQYFRTELMNALRILQAGHIHVDDMTGSWAGAMGQCQFMPSSYLKYAVDYDNDGKADIWNTQADVFASIAHYLSQEGWDGDDSWGVEVSVPDNFSGESGLKITKSLAEWKQRGITLASGEALPDSRKQASLVFPDEQHTGAFLVYNNFRTIMRWNRSRYFAAAVGILSDKIAAR